MVKRLLFITMTVLIIIIFNTSTNALEVGGINIPNSINVNNGKLRLNGTGVLKCYGMIDAYAAGLYLSKESHSPQEIISANEIMLVRLYVIARGYTKNQWVSGWKDGLIKATNNTNYDIGQDINIFNSFFNEDSNKNDYYNFLYVPGKGTTISKNDKILGNILNPLFKNTLFSVWLGSQKDEKNVKISILDKIPPEEKLKAEEPKAAHIKELAKAETSDDDEISKKTGKTLPTPQPLKKGHLFIDSDPPDVEVKFINIKSKFSQGIELEEGKYNLKISAEGYEPKKILVSLKAGEDKKQKISLKKLNLNVAKTSETETNIQKKNLDTEKKVTIPDKKEKQISPVAQVPVKPTPTSISEKIEVPPKKAPDQPKKAAVAAPKLATGTLKAAPGAGTLEIGGILLPDTIVAASNKLVLNGAGLRRKFGIKIYAGGLYLKKKTTDPNQIYPADEPMAARLHLICRGLTGAQWSKGWEESFSKATDGNTSAIKDRIDSYVAFFQDGSKENDYYDILYSPGQGVSVSKNGTILGYIKGFDFKQVLFSIWVGLNPGDSNLKKGMLGGSE